MGWRLPPPRRKKKIRGVYMGIVEEIVSNKEELILKFIDVLSGKEATARVNLDGVQFKLGSSRVKLEGQVSFTLVPGKRK
jgi:hypothetical protein